MKQDPNFRIAWGEVRRTNCALKFLVARSPVARHVYLSLMCQSLLEQRGQAILLLNTSEFHLCFSRKGKPVDPKKNYPAKTGSRDTMEGRGLGKECLTVILS